MNKTLATIFILFLASVGLVWYSAKFNQKRPQETVFVVGLNAEYPPFAFVENNKLDGFDLDLINEISTRLEKKIELKKMPFSALIPGIQTGNLDIIISGITPTPQRAKQILFTEPYLTEDPLAIVSLAQSPLKTVDDLQDKRVVVNEGFSADFYISKIKGPEIVRLETIDQALLELLSGRADAFVSALKPLQPLFKVHGKEQFNIAEIPETEEVYAIGIAKQRSTLLKDIQDILDTMEEDGTLDLLKKKWNLDD